MAQASAGNFIIFSDTEIQGAATSQIAVGAGAGHRIVVQNRSTLPYDFRASNEMQAAPRALSFGGASPDHWTAQFGPLAGLQKSPDQIETLDPHGPAAQRQNISVVDFQYRLATGGIPVGAGGNWQSLRSTALPLLHQVDVV